MDAKHWNGDDNTTAADMTDAERDERERELEELEQPLTDEERIFLRQAQAVADAILKAAGVPMARRTCERCGAVKPAGQSCGCFDNGSE